MSENIVTTEGSSTAMPTILCVDDEPNILSALRRLFRGHGWQIQVAESGPAGLALLESAQVDLVISDMRMPQMDGAQFLAAVRQRWPDTLRLLLTGHSDIGAIIDAINRGEIYRYVTKPWDDNDMLLIVGQALQHQALTAEKQRLEALTAQQNEELKQLNVSLEAKVAARTAELKVANDRLKASFITSIKVFSTLMEMRGGNLAGHSRRVADLARRIAVKLQLDDKQVQDIFVAGLLHEIGKVGFADELLRTPVAMMKPEQLDSYRNHTVLAEQLLLPLQDLRDACEIITAQFERFDGSGFPAQLAREAIPIGARILCLASDYDNLQIGALAQARLSPVEARVIIAHGIGQRYDPDVVNAFVAVLDGMASKDATRESWAEVSMATDQLQAGMTLSRDLFTPSGMLMLAAGHVLDVRLIQRIKAFQRSGNIDLSVPIRIA